MKLRGKFNSMLLLVFGLALGASGYFSHRQLNENARGEVLSNASVLMETILSARTWAVNEVGPNLRETGDDEEMLMMGVPAYAAEKVMEAVQKRYPDYGYREVALNPTNVKHRPADWEAKIVNSFRSDVTKLEEWGIRQSAKGPILYLAHPIQIKQSGCLGCHTTPEKSPVQLVAKYGSENGYGWKLKEIIGAQIVTVPLSVPVENANRMFITFMTTLTGVFVAVFVLLNLMLNALVISRVSVMANIADEISKGNFEMGEFNEQGSDEVAQLSASFNRMRRSLVKAMELFNSQPGS
jgi:HAMP domain-containing protein